MDHGNNNAYVYQLSNLIDVLSSINDKQIKYLETYKINLIKDEKNAIYDISIPHDTEYAFTKPRYMSTNMESKNFLIPTRGDFSTCFALLSLLETGLPIKEIEVKIEAKDIFENFSKRLLTNIGSWFYPGFDLPFDIYTAPFRLEYLKKYYELERKKDIHANYCSNLCFLALKFITNNMEEDDAARFDKKHDFSSFLTYGITNAVISWIDIFPESNISEEVCKISSNLLRSFIIDRSNQTTIFENVSKIFNDTIIPFIKDYQPESKNLEFLTLLEEKLSEVKLTLKREIQLIEHKIDDNDIIAKLKNLEKVIDTAQLKDFLPTRITVEKEYLKKVFEWSEKQLFQQLSFHKMEDNDRLDPIRCIYSLKIYILCNTYFSSIRKKSEYNIRINYDRKLVSAITQCIFEDFKGGGLWKKYLPILSLPRNSGNVYPFALSSLNEIFSIMSPEDLSQDHLESIYDAVDWITENELIDYNYNKDEQEDISSVFLNKTYYGWRSPQTTYPSGNPECWSTALVFEMTLAIEKKLRLHLTYIIIQNFKHGKFRQNNYRSKEAIRKHINEEFLKSRADSIFTLKEYSAESEATDYTLFSLKKCLKELIKANNNAFVLYGEPGTGKTTLVEQIAEDMGYSFLRIDTGILLREGIDNATKSIDNVFELLKKLEHTVILFDEIDESIKDRESENTTFENRILTNTLLTKLNDIKNKKIIYFVNTNIISEVDKAILREGRFDAILCIDHPYFEELLKENEVQLRKKLGIKQDDRQHVYSKNIQDLSKALKKKLVDKKIVSFPYRIWKNFIEECIILSDDYIQQLKQLENNHDIDNSVKSSWNELSTIFDTRLDQLLVDVPIIPNLPSNDFTRFPLSIKKDLLKY